MRQILFILLAGSLLASCKKNEDVPFNKAITGTWQEHETGPAFAGTTYRISFEEDGTYKLIIDYWTDMITGDPCTDPHYIYTYGMYSASNGILTLAGHFSDSTFNHIVSHCNNGTEYRQDFHFAFNRSQLILNSNYPGEYGKIRLIKE